MELISSFQYFDVLKCVKSTQTKEGHSIDYSLKELAQTLRKSIIPNECLLFYKDGKRLYNETGDANLSRDYFPRLIEDRQHFKFWDSYKASRIINADKCSVKIFSIDNYSSFWHILRQSFEFLYNCESSLNYYYTPSGGKCFTAHSDPYDLFVLQVEGSKRWKVYNKDKKEWDSILLNCGDVLYLKKGVMHEAMSEDSPSGHVTLGFKPTSLVTISKMIEYSCNDPDPTTHLENATNSEELYLLNLKNYFGSMTELDIATYFIKKDISKMNLDFYLEQSFFPKGDSSKFEKFRINESAYYKVLKNELHEKPSFQFLGNAHICEIAPAIVNFLRSFKSETQDLTKKELLKELSSSEIDLLISIGVLIGL